MESKISDQEVLKSDNFQYLGQIIYKDEEIEEDACE
jgi:hypothetical protein